MAEEKKRCDGQIEGGPCKGSATVKTKSGLWLCRDCAVEFGGEFATLQDENRVRWFRDSLLENDDGS
jgi:hypothetical protein